MCIPTLNCVYALSKYVLPTSKLVRLTEEMDPGAGDGTSFEDLKWVGVHKLVHLDGKQHYRSLEFFAEFIPVNMLTKTM